MEFTVMGFKVSNAAQARSVLVVAVLNGNKVVADQCRAVIKAFESC
jgi:hypothetical protein